MSNKIDLSLIATVVIFLASLWWAARTERIRKTKEQQDADEKHRFIRRQYLVALREEIGLNIEGIKKFVGRFPSRDEFTTFLNSKNEAKPLVSYSNYSVIFKNRTEVLQDLPDTLIKNIVDFYGKLDEAALDCAAIAGTSFDTISKGGKLDTLLDIKNQFQVALQQGETMKDAITQHLSDKYPTK